MKSRKDLFKILQSYEPYLSGAICNYIYSYICPGKCFLTKDGWCSRCGIGYKYHYYNKYQNSIKTIQQWLNKYYFTMYICCERVRIHRFYDYTHYRYCKKRIPRKVYNQYKSFKCQKHAEKYIDIFGVYRKPYNEDYHYRLMMASRNT